MKLLETGLEKTWASLGSSLEVRLRSLDFLVAGARGLCQEAVD